MENIREKMIEQRLVLLVEKAGGTAFKFTSPGHAGVPDRLVVLPGGKIYFVEVKAPGREPRPLQQAVMNKLRCQGCQVFVVDSYEAVEELPGLGG